MRYLEILFVLPIIIAWLVIIANVESSFADKTLARAFYRNAIQVGQLADGGLTEASGLASSHLRDDLLWAINDSGNEPLLYAIRTNVSILAKIRVLDAPNRDWEDLASFRLQDKAYLLIADIGDNAENRESYFLYIVEEPVIKDKQMAGDSSVVWAWRMRFNYEDGPRDSESVAVDLPGRQILLLSKRTKPPVLYRLPLITKSKESVHIATRLTAVSHIPQPTIEDVVENPEFGHFQSQPTAMDLSPNGSKAVVLTYKNAYLFTLTADKTWMEVFSGLPRLIPLPRMKQAEALCFSIDGKTLFVTSEKRPAPLLRLDELEGIGD